MCKAQLCRLVDSPVTFLVLFIIITHLLFTNLDSIFYVPIKRICILLLGPHTNLISCYRVLIEPSFDSFLGQQLGPEPPVGNFLYGSYIGTGLKILDVAHGQLFLAVADKDLFGRAHLLDFDFARLFSGRDRFRSLDCDRFTLRCDCRRFGRLDRYRYLWSD